VASLVQHCHIHEGASELVTHPAYPNVEHLLELCKVSNPDHAHKVTVEILNETKHSYERT